MYSNGDCERLAAKVIKKYSIPRNKVNITTKCLAAVAEDPSVFTTPFLSRMSESKDYVNQVMLSRQAIFNSVNKSLERLETDYIDLLMIHRFDPYTPIEETMEALHDLVKMGKVRASLFLPWWASLITQACRFDTSARARCGRFSSS